MSMKYETALLSCRSRAFQESKNESSTARSLARKKVPQKTLREIIQDRKRARGREKTL